MLRIHTFGGLSVAHPERELTGAVLQPRRLALLAVLARAGDRGVTRERLLSLFWPDEDEERARRALTQAIYALRRDLCDESTIVGNQELRLDAECITSDVAEFLHQLKRGQLAEAVALYTGPFLQGFHLVGAPAFERWADDERTAIAHDYARARERLALSAERANQMTEAVEHWRVLASVDPLNAKVALRYMKALEATNDRAGALRHARIYEALVSQELELPPDREVCDYAAQLRAAPQQLPAAARDGVAHTAPFHSDTQSLESAEQRLDEVSSQPARESIDDSVTTSGLVSAVAFTTPSATSTIPPAPSGRSFWMRPMQIVLGAAAVLALAAAIISRQAPSTDINTLRVGETVRVTFDEGLELDPAISPDGNLVAYASGTEGSMKLYVRQLDGSNPVLISGAVPGDHRRPRWSKAGTHILFQADRAIWMVPSLGGSARVIVEAPADTMQAALYPAWSPDGKSLAWMDGPAIRTRDVDGTAVRSIANLRSAHSLTWSPDGKLLAAAVENDAFTYGARGPLQFAGVSIGNIAPGAIFVVNVASGDTARLTPTDYLATSPEWLGDSRTLVFVSNQDGARDLYLASVNARGERAGNFVRLTTGLDAHSVSVARDGRTIAFTTFRQSANLYSIAIGTGATASVNAAEPVTRGQQTIETMDVSPDGKWIAFDSDRGGQQDIYRIRTDLPGDIERIVSSPTDDFHPAWSPDGRTIAFYRIIDGIRRGAVVGAAGGTVRFVGPEGGKLEEHSPVWSPDGQQLLFHRFLGGHSDLYSIARTSDTTWSTPVRVTESGGIWPAFSPDGKSFAYFSGPGEISIMATGERGSSHHVIVEQGANGRTAMYLRWTPNRNGLLVRARDAAGLQTIFEVSPNGQSWRPLVVFNDARRPSIRPEFATDGRRIYFTLAERTADVFTARLASHR